MVAIIEDNPADVFLFKLALTSRDLPADLIVKEDGEAGFDLIQEIDEGHAAAPAVFILDLSLPRKSGPELLERIRLSPVCGGARIVVASSSHNPKDKAVAAQAGADYYFVKPSSFDEFMKIGEIVSDLLAS